LDFHHKLANVGHSVYPSRNRFMQHCLTHAIGECVTVFTDCVVRVTRKFTSKAVDDLMELVERKGSSAQKDRLPKIRVIDFRGYLIDACA
jgi:hypothetical protein